MEPGFAHPVPPQSAFGRRSGGVRAAFGRRSGGDWRGEEARQPSPRSRLRPIRATGSPRPRADGPRPCGDTTASGRQRHPLLARWRGRL